MSICMYKHVCIHTYCYALMCVYVHMYMYVFPYSYVLVQYIRSCKVRESLHTEQIQKLSRPPEYYLIFLAENINCCIFDYSSFYTMYRAAFK